MPEMTFWKGLEEGKGREKWYNYISISKIKEISLNILWYKMLGNC